MVVFPLYPRVGSMKCCEGLQLSKYHPNILKYDPNVLYFACCSLGTIQKTRAKYRDQRKYDTASWDCHVYWSVERDMAWFSQTTRKHKQYLIGLLACDIKLATLDHNNNMIYDGTWLKLDETKHLKFHVSGMGLTFWRQKHTNEESHTLYGVVSEFLILIDRSEKPWLFSILFC